MASIDNNQDIISTNSKGSAHSSFW